jgi:hypothetical protein
MRVRLGACELSMCPPNSIAEELHTIREALAEASDNDLAKIVKAARDRQQKSGHEIVRLPPKRVTGFVAMS